MELLARGEYRRKAPSFRVPETDLPIREHVTPGTWFARDNVFNFIKFCRLLEVMKVVREASDWSLCCNEGIWLFNMLYWRFLIGPISGDERGDVRDGWLGVSEEWEARDPDPAGGGQEGRQARDARPDARPVRAGGFYLLLIGQ